MILRFLKSLLPPRSPLRLGWHYAKAFLAALREGFPARRLTVIAITGTDGKTTTTHMVGHILHEAGKKTGVISTVATIIADVSEPNVTQKTSVNPFLLQKTLKRMVNAGCEYAVIEVSSHGLVQGRVHHIFPRVAAVTNVTPEHLDYHKTMAQYIRDKGKLFRMLRGKGVKVLNGADVSFEEYRKIPSQETIVWNDLGPALTLSIPGSFNIENALCAMACASAVGISQDVSRCALESFRGVPGRLEEIAEGQPFRVFTDFTVTPAAYEKTLHTLRAMLPRGKRLLVLAGSCGNRMREKRPLIGKICGALADILILTSDETYGEPHEKIIAEIKSGVADGRAVVTIIPDRREAIRSILREAHPGDIVAICGMAGVTTMMTARGQIPWDEGAIVREEVRKKQKS